MIEIKKCPFCGKQDTFIRTSHNVETGLDEFYIECYWCGARTGNFLKMHYATGMWNMRNGIESK